MTKPCLEPGCGQLITTGTRCPPHEQQHQRARNANPQRTTRYGPAHRRAAAALLADGPWPCHWQTPGVCTTIATQADHVPGGYVRSCGPCNSSRGGRNKQP